MGKQAVRVELAWKLWDKEWERGKGWEIIIIFGVMLYAQHFHNKSYKTSYY